MSTPPSHRPFDTPVRATFRDLVLWRRDVRRFRTDPVDDKLLDDLYATPPEIIAEIRAIIAPGAK